MVIRIEGSTAIGPGQTAQLPEKMSLPLLKVLLRDGQPLPTKMDMLLTHCRHYFRYLQSLSGLAIELLKREEEKHTAVTIVGIAITCRIAVSIRITIVERGTKN